MSSEGDLRGRRGSGEIRLDEMVAAAKTGSNSALGRALSACRPQLLRAARRGLTPALRRLMGASDIVQDTFINATKAFPVFRGASGSQFLNWLRRILSNRIAQVTRRERGQLNDAVPFSSIGSPRRLSTLIPSRDPSPSSICSEREITEMIRVGLARLPERDQRVLVLRFNEGQSFVQMGQRLELSEDAARMAFSRAIERLRCELAKNGREIPAAKP